VSVLASSPPSAGTPIAMKRGITIHKSRMNVLVIFEYDLRPGL